MATGSQFAAFNLKMLLGFQDLGARGILAVRASHIEATQARWDVDGVFNTKLTMSSPGASQVQVDGTSKSTDGLGHVLTVSSAYKNVAPFQNTNAVVYDVGLMYVEVPAGVRINPRTGKPQYDRYQEEVGFQAAPVSVVDNGNGTITFNVNSVTEAGVTNAGRIVRVYKVVPADGANTLPIAVEECTVAFGANNTITTVGKLGQTTVSVATADYLVVCMGPRVSRNTPLSTAPGVVYIGTVTGNGGTPVAFSNASQTLLKTFQDASQIVYTPSLWLAPGATNVQLALDALVAGLQSSTPSGAAAGSARVGMYAPDWTAVASGGVGNVADATFTTNATLTNLGTAIDRAIRKRFAIRTKNDGNASSILAEESTGTSLANQAGAGSGGGSVWWLRTLNNASTTPYLLSATTTAPNFGSYIFGEFSDPSQASPHLRKTRIATSGNINISGGKWQRVWIDPPGGALVRFGGTGAKSGLILEDFGLNGGNFAMDGQATAAAEDQGFHFKDGVIKPKDEATKGFAASWVNGTASVSSWLWATFENLLVYGPSATQTSPAGAGNAVILASQLTGAINASTVATQPRPLVYRDCVIVMQRTTDFAAVSCTSQHKVVFENCHFFGMIGAPTGGLIVCGASSHFVMRDCVVFAPEGSGIDMNPGSTGVHATLDNVTIVAGFGGSSSIAAPCALQVYGDGYGAYINNCRVLLGPVMQKQNGTAAAQPMVQIGRSSGSGFTSVRNLAIKVEGGGGLGYANLVNVQSTLVGAGLNGTYVDGLFVNCGGIPIDGQTSNPVVSFGSGDIDKRVNIDHFLFTNIGRVINATMTSPMVFCGDYVTGRCWDIRTPDQGSGADVYLAGLRIGSFCYLDDVMFVRSGTERYSSALVIGSSNNILENFRSDAAMAPVSTPSQANFIYLDGDKNIVTRFVCPLSTAGGVPGIKINGRDNHVCNGIITCITNTAAFPVLMSNSATRRNKFTDMDVQYEGTTSGAVSVTSQDSLVDSCTFYRSAGAQAAVSNGAAGSVTGSTVTSTTL